MEDRLPCPRDVRALLEESTAVILAGGLSSRMNGQKKSSLQWQGRSFLDLLRRELDIFPRVVVSVDRREGFDPALPMVEDRYVQYGPLGGICSCLLAAQTPLVFFVACDMPLFTRQAACFLYSRWQPEDEACIAKTADGRLHPLCGIYRRELAAPLQESLERGERRVMGFLAAHAVGQAEIPPALEAQMTNVNTPQAYRALCDRHGG